MIGGSAPLNWQLSDQLSLYTGPRIAVFWIVRAFDLEAYRSVQNYLTAAPGWMAAAAWAPLPRFELSLQGQFSVTYLVIDGEASGRGFAGVLAAGGYRF